MEAEEDLMEPIRDPNVSCGEQESIKWIWSYSPLISKTFVLTSSQIVGIILYRKERCS